MTCSIRPGSDSVGTSHRYCSVWALHREWSYLVSKGACRPQLLVGRGCGSKQSLLAPADLEAISTYLMRPHVQRREPVYGYAPASTEAITDRMGSSPSGFV